MLPLYIVLSIVLGVILGGVIGRVLTKGPDASGATALAEAEAAKIRTAAADEIAALRQAAEVEGKETALRLKSEAEEDLRARRAELL